MEPVKFRKKPVVVEVCQFQLDNIDDICKITGLRSYSFGGNGEVVFQTVQGEFRVNVGDWVIRNKEGRCKTLSTEEFLLEYEPVYEGELDPAHTLEEDFSHFLSYSGLTREKPGHRDLMRRAFEAARNGFLR